MAVCYGNKLDLAEQFQKKGNNPVLIVGSGFFGTAAARQLADLRDRRVILLERRSHLGGNSYSSVDPKTGIEVHRYGSHIFHTKSKRVWDYLSRFTKFNTYRHKVMITYRNRVYPMPISLMTINDFFGKNLRPSDVDAFLSESTRRFKDRVPANLEEKAISLIGEELYRAFIEGYTSKQWGRPAVELPAEIITRLPVRHNYNIDYFSDPYQGIPLDGYGAVFERFLDHPNIQVFLNTDYFDVKNVIPENIEMIWTGMADQLLDYKYGPLEWRGLRFEWESVETADFQGTSVMNYADIDVPYTRIHEFKHYHPERAVFESPKTIICREYPSSWSMGDEAFYPVNNAKNQELYKRYADEIERNPRIHLGGRLGAYKYWDMDKAIENALDLVERL